MAKVVGPRNCEKTITKTPVFPDAGGITAISRWLSEATPPESIARENSNPGGIPDAIVKLGKFLNVVRTKECDPARIDRRRYRPDRWRRFRSATG
jgi:hypothetical protein